MFGRLLRRWVVRVVDAEVARALAERRDESGMPPGWESGEVDGWTQVGGVHVGMSSRCGRCGGPLLRTASGGRSCPDCAPGDDFAEPYRITAL